MGQSPIETLVALAMAVEDGDPIDWGMLEINERDTYTLFATHVLDRADSPIVDKAVITKLLVENFVLNMQLMKAIQNVRN